MTFWGTEYFKSINNKEVRYGTMINHKIFRQISPESAEEIELLDFGPTLMGLSLLFILPFVTIGSLLPTWMFINSLQLLAHLPLLNSSMPANSQVFLNKYLNWVRWYDEDFIKDAESKLGSKQYDVDVGDYHELLRAYGYEHLIAHNMMIVLIAIGIILFVWVILAVKDCFATKVCQARRPCSKTRHESSCNNFLIRFFYEFFLEFCIVIMINLSVLDFSEFSPSFSYLITIALMVVIVFITALLIFHLLCKKGPYVSDYYKKGTLW